MRRAIVQRGKRVPRLTGEFRGGALLKVARRHAEFETEFEDTAGCISYVVTIGGETFDKRLDSTWIPSEVHKLARAVAEQVRAAERERAELQAETDKQRRLFGTCVLRLANARARSRAAALNGGLRGALKNPEARALLAIGCVSGAVEMERIHRLAVHALPKAPGRPTKKPDRLTESVVAVYVAAGRTRTHAVQLAHAILTPELPQTNARR